MGRMYKLERSQGKLFAPYLILFSFSFLLKINDKLYFAVIEENEASKYCEAQGSD